MVPFAACPQVSADVRRGVDRAAGDAAHGFGRPRVELAGIIQRPGKRSAHRVGGHLGDITGPAEGSDDGALHAFH
jgi:hypothetical protein